VTACGPTFCTGCGTEAARSDRFCAACGTPVGGNTWPPPSNDGSSGAATTLGRPGSQPDPSGQGRPRTRPGFFIALGVLAAPLIAFGAYAGVSGGGSNSQGDALDSYPANIEVNFLNACEAGGAPADSCRCAFQQIQSEFSIEEFDVLEREMALTGVVPAPVAASVSNCGLPPAAPAPSPSPALTPQELDAMSDIVEDAANFLRQGFEVEASNPRLVLNHSDDEYLCVDLGATNRGDREQLPLGTITALRPSGSVAIEFPVTLSGGGSVSSWFDLVTPGATTTATKCFATRGERGTFAVRWERPVDDDLEWSFQF
jgi:hypothetical protein